MKYQTVTATGFWLPENEEQTKINFMDVLVAKGDWDGEEDADDERIFFYMDGKELKRGDIIADEFVVIEVVDTRQQP
jgi:hypothetical protein